MPKRTATFTLSLPDRVAGTPVYRWLCDALRREILERRLGPGARLPATRDLASQYGLSRGTIVSAFDQLKAEGYIDGSVGSGTYVNRILPDDLLHVSRVASSPAPVVKQRARRVSDQARRVTQFAGFAPGSIRAFRSNQPALDLFPTTLWAQTAARRLRHASRQMLLDCDPLGYRPLQEAVADYLATSRGVKCGPEQVAIVSGMQESLDLAARLFLNPGDRVGMEDPGYPGASLGFEAAGAELVLIGVDGEGMELPGKRRPGLRLVYLTPGHQFPLGISMTLPRRLALLEWARESGAMILEDDYDSEYRYAGRPVPALQGLDRDGQVLFAGSFSKVLFPSIRLGYLVIPLDLVERFAAMKSLSTRHAPVLEQAVLCDFITEGHFGRHIRRMREVYAERREVLLESAGQRLDGLLEISGVEAGLQTAGWLQGGIDATAAARAAARRDVQVTPLSDYSRGRSVRAGLLLGFAAVDAQEIRRGVRDLAIALEGERRLKRS